MFGNAFKAGEFPAANAGPKWPPNRPGEPGSGGHNKKEKTVDSERKRKADAARKRREKANQRGMISNEVAALQEELEVLRAHIRNQDKVIDELSRSKEAKVAKGFFNTYSHSENVPVINECVAIVRNGVPNAHALMSKSKNPSPPKRQQPGFGPLGSATPRVAIPRLV